MAGYYSSGKSMVLGPGYYQHVDGRRHRRRRSAVTRAARGRVAVAGRSGQVPVTLRSAWTKPGSAISRPCWSMIAPLASSICQP